MQEVYDFLKACGTYYLATVEGDQPRVRPFGTIDKYEGKLYIQSGKSKSVYAQLDKNPKAELCAFKDGTWLRVECELVPDDSIEAQKHMLEEYPELAGMYQPGDGNNVVMYMKNATAYFCSFQSENKIVCF